MEPYDGLYVAAGLVLGFLAGTAVTSGAQRVRRPGGALSRAENASAPAPDAARDVLIALSADGKITFLNHAFRETTGLSRREWSAARSPPWSTPRDWVRADELLKQLGEGQSPPAVEARLLAASGRHVAVELTATPLGGDGAPQGACCWRGRWRAGRARPRRRGRPRNPSTSRRSWKPSAGWPAASPTTSTTCSRSFSATPTS